MPELSAVDAYLDLAEGRHAPLVRELDRIIMAARPDLQGAVRYRILMYAFDGRYRDWVCAVDARAKVVSLRFLHGDRLQAPAGILRRGSTTMGTIDLTSPEQIDADRVTDLVRQAAALVSDGGAADRRPDDASG